MKILVCTKEVPDTAETPRVAADSRSIEGEGIPFVMSPFDENALEAALSLRDAEEDSEIVVLSLGRSEGERMLRSQALAMGADRGVLIDTPALTEGDSWSAAAVVAAWVRRDPPDLVLCGKLAVDDGLGCFGPALAEALGWPCVTEVHGLESLPGEGRLRLERSHSEGTAVLSCPLPAVVTTEKALNVPRFPTLKGKIRAKKAPIDRPTAEELGLDPGSVEATRLELKELRRPPEGGKSCVFCEGTTEDAARELVQNLRSQAKAV